MKFGGLFKIFLGSSLFYFIYLLFLLNNMAVYPGEMSEFLILNI